MTEIEELARKWFDEDEREAEDLVGMACPARDWADAPEELRERYLSRAREVTATVLRDAANRLARKQFLLPKGHASMGTLVDWLRTEADRIEATK